MKNKFINFYFFLILFFYLDYPRVFDLVIFLARCGVNSSFSYFVGDTGAGVCFGDRLEGRPETVENLMVPSGSSGGSNSVGGGSLNMGGSNRSSGWTSFDLGVLEEPFPNEEGEEVAQPHPPPENPVASPGAAQEALPQARDPNAEPVPREVPLEQRLPNLEAHKNRLRQRFFVHNPTLENPVDEDDLEAIIALKSDIFRRMSELENNHFWLTYEGQLIEERLLHPNGKEFTLETLRRKLLELQNENALLSYTFRSTRLIREEVEFFGWTK